MTEKNYNPEQKMAKPMKKQEAHKVETHHQHEMHKESKKENEVPKETEAKVEKHEHKEKKAERPKKTRVSVNATDVGISTKQSSAICYFIKRKKIQQAINDLEQVAKLKRAVPMSGEIPHRKGNMMSGRFPQKAAKEFIILLKSLAANSSYHGLENPVIVEAFANIGARPFGRGGIRRKRTHITITAETKKPMEGKK